LGGVFGAIDEKAGIACVHRALELGINFLDVSPYYGQTKAETVLGQALHGVPRDSYFLATKVGRYGENEFDFSRARVLRSVRESCLRLGVDRIDLVQCHDIEFGDLRQIIEETLPALRELQSEGVVRAVGITGLPLQIFREVLAATDVDTILSYCRYSLNDTSLASLLPPLQEKGVGVISASPLSMGLLTRRGAPDWHPAPEEIKTACRRAAEYCNAHGADIAQLALQYATREERIAVTLVGTAKAENIESNVRWIEAAMDESLLAAVLEILQPIHNRTWLSGRPENNT
jgi:aryl-alcohol dehydrogenase-like predicted oxidoreductase